MLLFYISYDCREDQESQNWKKREKSDVLQITSASFHDGLIGTGVIIKQIYEIDDFLQILKKKKILERRDISKVSSVMTPILLLWTYSRPQYWGRNPEHSTVVDWSMETVGNGGNRKLQDRVLERRELCRKWPLEICFCDSLSKAYYLGYLCDHLNSKEPCKKELWSYKWNHSESLCRW